MPTGRQVLIVGSAVAVAGLAFLLIPRPEGWVGDYVHKEDGSVFLTDFLHGGLSRTFDHFSGYMLIGSRLVTASCAEVTTTHFPGCVALETGLIRLAAAVLALAVLSTYARSWRWGLCGAALFLFLPVGQWEALGNVTNLRWFLVAAAAFALIGVFDSLWLIVLASSFAVLAALGDPVAFLLLPLAVLRVVTVRGRRRWPSAMFIPAAVVQVALLQPAERGGTGALLEVFEHPWEAIQQLFVRGVLVTQYGVTGTEAALRFVGPLGATLLLAVPLAVAVLAIKAGSEDSRGLWLAALLTVLGTLAFLLTISFQCLPCFSIDHWHDVGSFSNRYSVTVGILYGSALVLVCSTLYRSTRWPLRAVAGMSLALLAIAVLGDFRGDKYNYAGPTWRQTLTAAEAYCRRPGARDPTVRVTPTNVPTKWTATLTCNWVIR